MKASGECPKCKSKEISVVVGAYAGITVKLGNWSSGAFTNLYICTTCGYIEIYVEDNADLPKIAERWPPDKN
ncbi:MAG: zinc ribbon domain-containing protein [Candidatus Kapaibacterium sp.]